MGKTLILYVSAGAGHKTAALALEKAVHDLYPEEDVSVEDILSFSNWSFKKIYSSGYLSLVKRAEHFYSYLYEISDKEYSAMEKKIRSLFNSINLFKFKNYLLSLSPQHIICTHYLPLERALTLRSQQSIRSFIACTVTDFCAHSFWVNGETDAYFVGNEETKRELIYDGISENRISVTGIPISSKFSRKNSAASVKKTLNLSPESPVVICMSGGFGVGPIEDILDSFNVFQTQSQVLVICGKNEDLKKNIQKNIRRWRFPLHVLGFVDNMHEVYDAGDIVVSKPGGLTTSEIMAKHKPFVIINPIPGQEERNSDFLLEKGIAVKAQSPKDVAFKVREILGDRKKYRQMKQMAKNYGRPDAAREIIKTIFSKK